MAAGLCLDPLGSLCAPPDLLAAMRNLGLLLREGKGTYSKGDGSEGREERVYGKGREGNPLRSAEVKCD